jgi:hypothetical protein
MGKYLISFILLFILCSNVKSSDHSYGDKISGSFTELASCREDGDFGIKRRKCTFMRICSIHGDRIYEDCGEWSSCRIYTPGT